MAPGATLCTLSASALGEIEIPLPAIAELNSFSALIRAGEFSYQKESLLARQRRSTYRELIIQQVMRRIGADSRASHATD